MAVKIGHASIDEHGRAQGGSAGDQTGREVCIRDWYAKGWTVMLRPISSEIAEKSAKACERACANDKIGYDQNQRNTLNTQAKKVGYNLSKITTKCETDCSALMTVCAQAAGVAVKYNSGNAPTTSTMRRAFVDTGKYKAYTDSKYLTGDRYLKRGDILVKEGSHTVMVLSDGSAAGKTDTKYYKKYAGWSSSIVDALNSVGIDSSFANRKKIAKANGVMAYAGTSAQNSRLLELLKKGKLQKP